MPRKRSTKKKKQKEVGIEAIVEPGVKALYVRGAWMKKLNKMGKRERELKRVKK